MSAKKLPTDFPAAILRRFDTLEAAYQSLRNFIRHFEDLRHKIVDVVNTHAHEGFSAYGLAANVTGTTSILIFDNEHYDDNGWYDTSTGKFTAPIAGRYMFGWAAWGESTPGNVCEIGLYVGSTLHSGSARRVYSSATATVQGGLGGSVIVDLSKSDEVTIKTTGLNADTVYASDDRCAFWGARIG